MSTGFWGQLGSWGSKQSCEWRVHDACWIYYSLRDLCFCFPHWGPLDTITLWVQDVNHRAEPHKGSMTKWKRCESLPEEKRNNPQFWYPPALFLNWESKQKEIKLKFLLVVFGFLKQYLFYTEVVTFTSLPFKDRFFHKLWSELNLRNKTLKVFSSLTCKKKEVLQFTLLPFVMKRANHFYKSIIHKK